MTDYPFFHLKISCCSCTIPHAFRNFELFLYNFFTNLFQKAANSRLYTLRLWKPRCSLCRSKTVAQSYRLAPASPLSYPMNQLPRARGLRVLAHRLQRQNHNDLRLALHHCHFDKAGLQNCTKRKRRLHCQSWPLAHSLILIARHNLSRIHKDDI